MKKILLVAFNGEMCCFSHVLLNALDMHSKGLEVKIIIEGAATKLIKELDSSESKFNKFYKEVKEKNLIESICKACANNFGVLEEAIKQEIKVDGEMYGHPSLEKYISDGYEVVTF